MKMKKDLRLRAIVCQLSNSRDYNARLPAADATITRFFIGVRFVSTSSPRRVGTKLASYDVLADELVNQTH